MKGYLFGLGAMLVGGDRQPAEVALLVKKSPA